MAKLLMITGYGGTRLAYGEQGAFYNTLEEFSKYWERIDIITPRGDGRMQMLKKIFGNVFIHPSSGNILFQPRFISEKGFEIYKKESFDVMTVHNYPPFYNGYGAKMLHKKIKVPYMSEVHHIVGYPRSSGLKEKLYLLMTKLFIKSITSKAKAVRVVNKKQVPNFLIKYGVTGNKIKYIPSVYIDLDVFRPMNMEKKYDLIFVGRLEKNKGLELFIVAAEKLNAKALIVGEGSEKRKSSNHIEYFGWAKDSAEVSKLINQSKILVMTSYNEGGPRVVLEAMACGIPVLATNVGIVSDILKDGKAGLIVKWDVDDIVKQAKKINKEYSTDGVKIANQFEKKKMIKNYADEVKKLI